MLEMELASAFAPQNLYCFAIDAKASPLFHVRIHQLAKCLPNVLITQHEFQVDSSGHNMGPSFFECLKLLAQPKMSWKYVHLLQASSFFAFSCLYVTVDIMKCLESRHHIANKFGDSSNFALDEWIKRR